MIGFDHALKAEVYVKFPGQEEGAYQSVLEGIRIDTTLEGKLKIITQWVDEFKKRGQRVKEADLYAKVLELKPKPNINDYFYPTRAYYFAKSYDKTRELALKMATTFPDEIFGYEWAFNASQVLDTVKKDSIAVPDALKLYEAALKDSVKFKKQIINTTRFLAGYYNNDAKDKEKALEFLRKWQTADTANATAIQGYIDALQRTPNAPRTTNPRGNSKPGGAPSPSSKSIKSKAANAALSTS